MLRNIFVVGSALRFCQCHVLPLFCLRNLRGGISVLDVLLVELPDHFGLELLPFLDGALENFLAGLGSGGFVHFGLHVADDAC